VTVFYSKSCGSWHLLLCIAFVSRDWCSDKAAASEKGHWNGCSNRTRKPEMTYKKT